MSAITETVSENTPKRKRGRPRSFRRLCADQYAHMGIAPEGCERSKINFSLTTGFLSLIEKATPEQQVRLMGYTWEEMATKHEGKLFPGAFMTGTEVTRYLDLIGDTPENRAGVIEIMLSARDREVPWKDIGAHFRKLRLGARHGNALSLFMHLTRAYDDYIRRFPATTQQARIAGIQNLLDAVENPED